MFVLVAAVIILVLVMPSIYAMYAGNINKPLLQLAKCELWLPALIFPDSDMGVVWRNLQTINPADLDWRGMKIILDYAGTWLRWPCLLCLVALLVWSMRWGSVESLKNRYNMEKLLANNAKNFPCLMPIVGKGKYLLSPDSYDKGLWKIARSPVQFALQHSLLEGVNGTAIPVEMALVNGLPSTELPAFGKCKFNEELAISAFKKQLGLRFTGKDKLSVPRKTMACAFILYALGMKKDCIAILDAVSKSYSENDGKPQCQIFEDKEFLARLNEVLEANWDEFVKRSAISRHLSYELPMLMAFLIEARKKGVLASSQFLWLRPVDRPLWYALNQCGGRAAWSEALSAWAHFQAEEHEKNSLDNPQIDAAVEGLKKALEAQGWFLDMFIPSSGATVAMNGVVAAPAEDENEE